MELGKVLLSNYLPYAKGTTIGRAIPAIDGFKPSQRRVLYTMFKMGLLTGNKAKSSKIVGQVMGIHPHGDSAIYETMVLMTTGNEGYNVPFVESKGNFGKVYSKDLAFAAPRYTEAKLCPISRELFEGIDEDAVRMIDNFDNTLKEPEILPVKFPNILVNASSGVAVGTSSNIPSFSLNSVCDATIGILKGEIKDGTGLAEVLKNPEFTTGGFLHTDKKMMENLCNKGYGTFTITGNAVTYPGQIVITEIPYNTTAEDIIEAIEEYAKTGELNEVRDIRDEIGLDGLKIIIEIKRGYDSNKVLGKILKYTSLRNKISYRTRVIIDDRCLDLSLFDVLEEWIKFRQKTIQNIYTYRLNKEAEQEHILKAWEIIKDIIPEIVDVISKNNESKAIEILNKKYGLDDKQTDYIMNMKVKNITTDNAEKNLKKLEEIRGNVDAYTKLATDEKTRKNLIVKELQEIKEKYGSESKTQVAEPVADVEEHEEVVISDDPVQVVLTKNGYVKRLITDRDVERFECPIGDEIVRTWNLKNNDHLLVFTYDGEVRKVLVDSIDATRRNLSDKLAVLAGIEDSDNILWIDSAGDYSGNFNLIYPNGKGVKIQYSRASGNRAKYISLYEPCEKGKCWITKEDQFFIITYKRKAAYADVSTLGILNNRKAFKVARIARGDAICGIQPLKFVPDRNIIDLDRYSKDYTVNIGDDVLW